MACRTESSAVPRATALASHDDHGHGMRGIMQLVFAQNSCWGAGPGSWFLVLGGTSMFAGGWLLGQSMSGRSGEDRRW